MKMAKRLLLSLLLLQRVTAGDACCNSAILDSFASKSEEAQGDEGAIDSYMHAYWSQIPAEVPDPEGMPMPEDWDEEDDGPWETLMMKNPVWQNKRIEVARNLSRQSIPAVVYETLGEDFGDVLAGVLDKRKLAQFASNASISVIGSCPWLIMGFVFTAAMQGLMALVPFLSADLINLRRVGRTSTLGNVFEACAVTIKGSLLGLTAPLCSCGCLPVALGLARQGASPGAVVAFVTAAQSAGLDSFTFTYGILGARVAMARLAGAAVLAVTAGLASECGSSPHSSVGTNSNTAASCCKGSDCEGKEDKEAAQQQQQQQQQQASVGRRVARAVLTMASSIMDMFEEVVPAVLTGMVVTSAITIFLPLSLLWGSNTAAILGRVLILGGVLPLQMCEHSVVAFAVALQKAGASPGTAFAFLLAAPASNFATLSLLGGAAVACRCAAGVVAAAVSLSYFYDSFGDKLVIEGSADHDLPAWFKQASIWAVAVLAAISFLKFLMKGMYKASLHTHQETLRKNIVDNKPAGASACCDKQKKQ